MSRRKRTKRSRRENKRQPQPKQRRVRSSTLFRELLGGFVPQGELFAKDEFHGNVKGNPEQLAAEALIWSWQEAKNVTDAFDQTLEICEDLGLKKMAMTYPAFMKGLDRYGDMFRPRWRERFPMLAERADGLGRPAAASASGQNQSRQDEDVGVDQCARCPKAVQKANRSFLPNALGNRGRVSRAETNHR